MSSLIDPRRGAEFPNDVTVEAAARELRAARCEWIDEHPQDERPHVDRTPYNAPDPMARRGVAERSIFDDLVTDPN